MGAVVEGTRVASGVPKGELAVAPRGRLEFRQGVASWTSLKAWRTTLASELRRRTAAGGHQVAGELIDEEPGLGDLVVDVPSRSYPHPATREDGLDLRREPVELLIGL